MQLASIQTDIVTSLKSGNTVRVETLRFLMAAIKNFAITKYGAESDTKLTETDVLEVVKKQVKSHKESVEAFQKAERTDLVDHEKQQLAILEEMLPAEITDDQLQSILKKVIEGGETNFGKLMGLCMKEVAGKAGGDRVVSLLKQLLKAA